ncbi:MAG: hypothetical protein A3D31_08930 [Candidatus Fluviicola riflensis]|nr:MAG: hypothetical protein CHH17_13340 [Candidatus Fluviicola riflensis]OGS77134.1 MAG: hypothetical protein A3D31_08930 [Candidatus Fluviicola riflensis]OGS82069.1 MAG: hypothetical protein A2724_17875 [Fluviicola sp. RIFCSPHIGHO2_01_FULL_43_53]OGS87763.1 MAG: hypothetical protein A3E30_15310 [Fluviicola sp. RIFCSPHIGHO2_12_FULL_43_24]
MSELSHSDRLHQAIADLQIKRQEQAELITEQFQYLREQLQPANLVKRVVSDVFASPDIRTGIVDYAIGVTSGMIAKKVVEGSSPNIVNQLVGNAVQMIVTREVSQHPDAIKNFGKNLLQRLF